MRKHTMQEIADFFGVPIWFDGYRTGLLDDYGVMCAVSNRLVYLEGVESNTKVAPVKDICTWQEDEDGLWHTSCHEIFEIHEGTPDENSMRFCPYCGRPIREEREKIDERDFVSWERF